MTEIWKKFLENYSVSNIGNIRNDNTNKLLNGDKNSSGYKRVTISRKHYFIHRLVAEMFIDNPENKPVVNHIDGNKLNNTVSNLEWVTKSENDLHAFKNNLRKTVNKRRVAKLDENENILEIFESIEATGSRNVGEVCRGIRKHCMGYKWKFIE